MTVPTPAHFRRVPLFSTLTDDEISLVASRAHARRFPQKSVVFHEGDTGDSLLVLVSGRAKVVLQSPRGQEVILAVIEAPDVLGHIALLDGAPRSATVIALDPIEAWKLERGLFLELLAGSPSLLNSLLTYLAGHIRASNEHLRTTVLFDIHGQVLRALVQLGKPRDASHIVATPRPTHQELAQMIGRNRETVTRALKELRDGGFVIVEPDAFVLPRKKLRPYWSA